MTNKEVKARETLVEIAASLYRRGYTHGATGNLSILLEDGILLSPTQASLGDLDPAYLAKVDYQGHKLAGPTATKELFLHLAVYQNQRQAGAVVHLHSCYSVAWSCLSDRPCDDVLPPLTAYSHMQCGHVALLPYFRPGDEQLAEAVAVASRKHWSILLAHHGPVVAGLSLRKAMYAVEELEETAKLALLVRPHRHRVLDREHLNELDQHFPPWCG